jgi:crotonobetainyl-CoA:carnitine CoA-transferase CaiB-like acyl-CoA transferase
MPFASMLLADLGAEVIKVEPPKGDQFRYSLQGSLMAALNRNKRGIVVNLKTDGGKEVLRRLVADADVFLESYIPGTIARLGFGYDDVVRLNPQIIYASISGFGQTGPYASKPGYDVVAQAMSGIMLATGDADGPPVRIGTSTIDWGTGMYTVIAVLAALLDRQRTGKGQRIDASLLETALSWMGHFVALYSKTGEVPQKMGSGLAFFTPYQVFEAADGYVFIGVSTDRFWQKFCEVLELDALGEDPRFATVEDRLANRAALLEALSPELKARSAADILAKLDAVGIPNAPLLDIGQIVEDPHIAARGLIERQDHPEQGPVDLVKLPFLRDGARSELERPSPRLGEHTVEVLRELGYSRQEIDQLVEAQAVGIP